jgi:hypothetical protein
MRLTVAPDVTMQVEVNRAEFLRGIVVACLYALSGI